MQSVMPHERGTDERQDGQAQHSEPDTSEGLHEGIDDARAPAVGQVLQLVEVVSDAGDAVGGVGQVAKAVPETGLEEVLVDGGADGDAYGGATAAGEVCQVEDLSAPGHGGKGKLGDFR